MREAKGKLDEARAEAKYNLEVSPDQRGHVGLAGQAELCRNQGREEEENTEKPVGAW